MKTHSAAGSKLQSVRAQADLADCLRTLFRRCPELIGLSFHDPDRIPMVVDASNPEDDLFVVEMRFSVPVSNGQYNEMCEMISSEIYDLVSEQPDIVPLIRGRTFTRTLH